MTRIPDVEGSDLVPRDPDVLSIGDRAAAEAATRKLAEGYEDRAWGCMSSRHKFCREPCPVYQPMRKAAYVIEMNAGEAEKSGVRIGAKVAFTLPN